MSMLQYYTTDTLLRIVYYVYSHLVHGGDPGRGEVVAVPRHLEAGEPVVHRAEPGQVRGVGGEGVGGLAGGDLAEGLGAADQLVQGLDDAGEGGAVGPLLLPAVQHQLVDGLGTVHGGRQPKAPES